LEIEGATTDEALATPLSGRRVLVTGGAGFIGSHAVTALRANGAEVIVADRERHPDPAVRSIVRDLTEPGAIEHALEPGTDAVLHLAAATSVLRSVEHPHDTYATNVAVTAALLERARQLGIESFVFASTNAVIGNHCGDGPINEFSAMRPLTPYGATKAAGEMLLSAYTSSYGLRCTALRLTNVYGPGMINKDSVVARLMRCARSGNAFDIFGDGRQIRDYVYVGDAVNAALLTLTRDITGPLVVGSATSTSVLDLVRLVQDTSGTCFLTRHVPPKRGEMSGVVVDNRRARSLGWNPSVSLRDGLAQVWETWGDRDHESAKSTR
jgi:UDP-glucose 4-epimerase